MPTAGSTASVRLHISKHTAVTEWLGDVSNTTIRGPWKHRPRVEGLARASFMLVSRVHIVAAECTVAKQMNG